MPDSQQTFLHQIDPIALDLGTWNLPLLGSVHPQVHWYGVMYLLGFIVAWWLGRRRIRAGRLPGVDENGFGDLMFYAMLGVVLGGRIGYILFYDFASFVANPLMIFKVWEGGMAFHGGFLGVLFAALLFGRKTGRSFFQITDFIAPLVPIGLAFGRLGNFINGELWGRVTDPSLPWGMVFRGAGDAPRHPSQIYQFLLEGVLLFILLWLYARQPRKMGQVSGAFLFGYGVFRFIAEYFREPDAHLGLLALGMSMGQWLCIPMIVAGAAMWLWATRRDDAALAYQK